jgi:hypothetical protein
LGAKGTRGLLAGAIALIALGVVLLLNNFLFLTGFNVTALLPLTLVIVGAIILLRGDIVPTAASRPFGITRGSVESGNIEVNAGLVDVFVGGLEREGRLIAGQYAHDSRPQLTVENEEAYLHFDRAAVPWVNFADWTIEVARDLPWGLFVSTSIGQINADCSGLILSRAVLATGLGGIRFVCPPEAFEPIQIRSAAGSIRVLTPPGIRARIVVSGPKIFRVHSDDVRYERETSSTYLSRDPRPGAPTVEIRVTGTFGDLYLA